MFLLNPNHQYQLNNTLILYKVFLIRDVFLYENGIGTLIQWGGYAVHQFKQLGFDIKLPKTEKFFERCIMLPMNIFISNEDVHYICDQINSFYRK